MLFILSFAVLSAAFFLMSNYIKKHPHVFYIAAALLSACGYFIDTKVLPSYLAQYVAPLVTNCIIGTAVWAIVMWTGALPNGSKLIKTFMPIRGELSIMAAILTIGHILRYGITYLKMIFKGRADQTDFLISFIVALLLVVIMTPLTVISIKAVRRKIKGKTWKNIQRFAYGFYALVYIHIMVVGWTKAVNGNVSKYIDLLCYSLIFIAYAVFRIRKYILVRKKPAGKILLNSVSTAAALACTAAVTVMAYPNMSKAPAMSVQPLPSPSVSSSQVSVPVSQPQVSTAGDSESRLSSEVSKKESSQTSGETSQKAAQTSKSSQTSKDTSKVSVSSVPAVQHSPAAEQQTPETTVTVTEEPVQQEQPADENQNNTAEQNPANDDTHNEQQDTGHTQTTQNTNQPAQQSVQQSTAPQPAPTPEPEPDPEPSVPQNVLYNDGVYTASAPGYDGDITVQVTVEHDQIIAIAAQTNEEDWTYFNSAKNTVINQILATQQANVDAVSEATYSSYGIMNAVQLALNSARI